MTRLALLAVLALASCADPHAPLGRDFGESVAANIAVQVVNPMPTPPRPPLTDGQRSGNAYDRYTTNKVYQPRPPIDAGKIMATPVQAQ